MAHRHPQNCTLYVQSVAAVETTLAYHFGERVLAEVDVVLPPSMALEEAHDVGQKLQVRCGLCGSLSWDDHSIYFSCCLTSLHTHV